jgi:hypothetical protein
MELAPVWKDWTWAGQSQSGCRTQPTLVASENSRFLEWTTRIFRPLTCLASSPSFYRADVCQIRTFVKHFSCTESFFTRDSLSTGDLAPSLPRHPRIFSHERGKSEKIFVHVSSSDTGLGYDGAWSISSSNEGRAHDRPAIRSRSDRHRGNYERPVEAYNVLDMSLGLQYIEADLPKSVAFGPHLHKSFRSSKGIFRR